MRTHKANPAKILAHHDDEAFKLLVQLETLFARMFPSRGSRWLRARLHAASARLAQLIIVASGEEDPNDIDVNIKPALRMCKIIDGILKLLRAYSVLNFSEHDEAVRLAVRLAKIVARRFFGFDVDDSDDGPTSPPASSPPSAAAAAASVPMRDIAAQPPPLMGARGSG
jgi:hypothetical protein